MPKPISCRARGVTETTSRKTVSLAAKLHSEFNEQPSVIATADSFTAANGNESVPFYVSHTVVSNQR